MQASLEARLDQLLRRHAELRDALADAALPRTEIAKLSKEYSELSPIVEEISALCDARAEMRGLREMADSGDDPELKALAEEELRTLRERVPVLEEQVRRSLLPKDADDSRNAIL